MTTKPNRSNPDRSADAPFGQLLASRPPRAAGGTAVATLASVVWHAALLGGLLYATRAIASEPEAKDEAHMIVEIAPSIPLPPPPRETEPPRAHAPDVTFGHQVLAAPDFVPPDIPPPDPAVSYDARDFTGRGPAGGRGDVPVDRIAGRGDGTISPDEAPHFVMTQVRPRILNPEEVVRALERSYPALLRDAGIGGDVTVWFFIDAEARVLKRLIDRSSTYDALDAAALKVADIMRFSPAENHGVRVPVWVSVPIRFTAR